MSDRWYSEAVVYCLDIDTYADSNGDGYGDIRGLIGRLDYLVGVTCLWLHPIHPSPSRDDGYDVTDFYGSTRASARSATSRSCCTRPPTAASGSSSTWSSTTPPRSTPGFSRPEMIFLISSRTAGLAELRSGWRS